MLLVLLITTPKNGGGYIEDAPILGGINSVADIEFDEIIVSSISGWDDIRLQLISAGVEPLKINNQMAFVQVQARINFLRDFSSINPHIENENLSVAEGGVYRGDFSKEINRYFPKQKLYLFDTFEGFDDKDISYDKKHCYSDSENESYFANTSVEEVLDKLPHKEQAIVKQGFFPETTNGLEDEQFLFVNLDFDLYNPTYTGLEFFYPKVISGGCILIHDYFTKKFKGIREAVADFEKETGKPLLKIPIGDHISICILKN